ncbi:stage 0 sporulation protein [bacterium (Candidatus Torokbacteria) CG_4_10_14_0_2_um_filter_35_8]|nr:MAG: stage 0 sporulation protein [bacterium (Candidatus Torokbacteria) CG_4_10_14_0_2_um_filter_35_8]
MEKSQIFGIQIYPWEKSRKALSSKNYKKGDKIVVNLNAGLEIGEIKYARAVDKENRKDEEETYEEELVIVRKATSQDLNKISNYENKEKEALNTCRDLIKKHNLPMKLAGVQFSLDGSRIIFAFTSDVRVDFRELVKDLSRNFQKSVRLQQIGSRDEASTVGGFGMCGRPLCCASFLSEIKSINTDMARMQQMAHRGSERITGTCGRLMCCLAYEEETYKRLSHGMPGLGEEFEIDRVKGKVIARNILKREVTLENEKGETTNVVIPREK